MLKFYELFGRTSRKPIATSTSVAETSAEENDILISISSSETGMSKSHGCITVKGTTASYPDAVMAMLEAKALSGNISLLKSAAWADLKRGSPASRVKAKHQALDDIRDIGALIGWGLRFPAGDCYLW